MQNFNSHHPQFILIASSIFISGCSGVLWSSLGAEDIRATAYDIATTSMATTIEVTINAPKEVDVADPLATVNPVYCNDEGLDLWYEKLFEDVKILTSDVIAIKRGGLDEDMMNDIYDHATQKIIEYNIPPNPPCTKKANAQLRNVYRQFKEMIEAVMETNPATMPYEKQLLNEEINLLIRQLRKLLPDKEFNSIKALLMTK